LDNVSIYKQQLKELIKLNSIDISEEKIDKLCVYADLLCKKNDIVNLVSRKDTENIIENHIFHALLMLKYTEFEFEYFLDIGTGGGLPGIPLNICFPDRKGVLIDSTQKKISAVNEFIGILKLKNVKGVADRVESKDIIESYSGKFDLVLSRATAPLGKLLKYAFPLIKNQSKMIFFKGGDIEEEINNAKLKYNDYIIKMNIFELGYMPTNINNTKEKKIIILEIAK